MSTQPVGTVTLVFTDIEGSTRLLEELVLRRIGRRWGSIGGWCVARSPYIRATRWTTRGMRSSMPSPRRPMPSRCQRARPYALTKDDYNDSAPAWRPAKGH